MDTIPDSILFRGIAWGIPATELEDELGLKLDDFSTFHAAETVARFLYDDGDLMNAPVRMYSGAKSLKGVKVAGYGLIGLFVYCVYVPGADGLLSEKLEDTSFIEAQYTINVRNKETTYFDIVSKLTELYGASEKMWSTGRSDIYTYNLWRAKDRSMVCASEHKYSDGAISIEIKYASGDADNLIEDAYNAFLYTESINAESNKDGL